MSDSIRTVNQSEFAAMVGLTTRQVRNLETKGIPVEVDGNRKLYPLPAAFRWYLAQKEEEIREDSEASEYQAALTRKMLAEARIAERKLAQLDGALIPMALHEDQLGRILDRLQARIRNLPGAWSDRLVDLTTPREVIVVLREMVDELSEELSGNASAIARDVRREELPDDFPEIRLLRDEGIELFAELLDLEDLTEITGIGPAKAERIQARLTEMGLRA